MATTTIAVETHVRDRLRTFGHAGMSYSQIIEAVLDEVDRERFVAELHRRADQVTEWVPLEDA